LHSLLYGLNPDGIDITFLYEGSEIFFIYWIKK